MAELLNGSITNYIGKCWDFIELHDNGSMPKIVNIFALINN